MKLKNRFLAILLSAVIAFSFVIESSAKSTNSEGEGYSTMAHIVDNAFGVAHDAIFSLLMRITRQKGIPTLDEYNSKEHKYFYKGTNGATRGDGWSAGFASASVIPAAWRCDADGKADPNGHNLKSIRATGGYQTFVSKLYTDQNLNMMILSNGTDSNNNGVGDIIVFASIDGVGLTGESCKVVRASVEKALSGFGVKASDILGINISATHCHAALDIQGMCIPTLFLNKLNPFTDYDRSLNKEMMDTIGAQAEVCAKEAYKNIEAGTLSFFETGKVNGASDKLNSGVQPKNYFSCFLFEGTSGENTIIANIGAHPTSYGAWDSNKMMCADYPYFMALALKDVGCNLVFAQSAQAAISSPSIDYAEGDEKDQAASAWVADYELTKEDWVERYGSKYADKWYDKLEPSMRGHMKKGYLLAQHILNAASDATPVAPVLNVKNARTCLSLDYGVMGWGSVSGLLGGDVVRISDSESGYGLMVETDYIEIGNDIAILTGPGELSPALMFGSDESYTGSAKWTGKTSWTGEEWIYNTLTDTVRMITGDSDKTVLLFGITNDALGYMYPDICTPNSLLGTLIFYKENPSDMANCMLMTVGTRCGSQLMEGYQKLLTDFVTQ